MSDSFANRLREAISNAGSIQNLGQRAQVAPRTISGYLVGKGDPSRRRLIALADAGEVSVEWLATGRNDPSPHQQHAIARTGDPNANEGVINLSGFAVIPEIDGNTSLREQQQSAHTEVDSIAIRIELLHAIGLNETDVRMLRARGDSMAPTIHEGDRLIVDTTVNTVRDDMIYVLRVDAEMILRRLQRDTHGGVWVITDAPHYENEHLARPYSNGLNIVGRPILCLTQSM